ncbi:MAG: hypothetical protein K0S07_1416 [Chlamydiales bacterium]|nr:hypothetical protein [Chlamydiales bacterium]
MQPLSKVKSLTPYSALLPTLPAASEENSDAFSPDEHPNDALFKKSLESKLLDAQGLFQKKTSLSIALSSIERWHQLLHEPIQLLFSEAKSAPLSLASLFQEFKRAIRQVAPIDIAWQCVGSTVPWVLGKEFFASFAQEMGIEARYTPKKPNDLDVRAVLIARGGIDSADYFDQLLVALESVLKKHLPFHLKKKQFNDSRSGQYTLTKLTFLKEGQIFELDFLLVKWLTHDSLFFRHGLSLSFDPEHPDLQLQADPKAGLLADDPSQALFDLLSHQLNWQRGDYNTLAAPLYFNHLALGLTVWRAGIAEKLVSHFLRDMAGGHRAQNIALGIEQTSKHLKTKGLALAKLILSLSAFSQDSSSIALSAEELEQIRSQGLEAIQKRFAAPSSSPLIERLEKALRTLPLPLFFDGLSVMAMIAYHIAENPLSLRRHQGQAHLQWQIGEGAFLLLPLSGQAKTSPAAIEALSPLFSLKGKWVERSLLREHAQRSNSIELAAFLAALSALAEDLLESSEGRFLDLGYTLCRLLCSLGKALPLTFDRLKKVPRALQASKGRTFFLEGVSCWCETTYSLPKGALALKGAESVELRTLQQAEKFWLCALAKTGQRSLVHFAHQESIHLGLLDPILGRLLYQALRVEDPERAALLFERIAPSLEAEEQIAKWSYLFKKLPIEKKKLLLPSLLALLKKMGAAFIAKFPQADLEQAFALCQHEQSPLLMTLLTDSFLGGKISQPFLQRVVSDNPFYKEGIILRLLAHKDPSALTFLQKTDTHLLQKVTESLIPFPIQVWFADWVSALDLFLFDNLNPAVKESILAVLVILLNRGELAEATTLMTALGKQGAAFLKESIDHLQKVPSSVISFYVQKIESLSIQDHQLWGKLLLLCQKSSSQPFLEQFISHFLLYKRATFADPAFYPFWRQALELDTSSLALTNLLNSDAFFKALASGPNDLAKGRGHELFNLLHLLLKKLKPASRLIVYQDLQKHFWQRAKELAPHLKGAQKERFRLYAQVVKEALRDDPEDFSQALLWTKQSLLEGQREGAEALISLLSMVKGKRPEELPPELTSELHRDLLQICEKLGHPSLSPNLAKAVISATSTLPCMQEIQKKLQLLYLANYQKHRKEWAEPMKRLALQSILSMIEREREVIPSFSLQAFQDLAVEHVLKDLSPGMLIEVKRLYNHFLVTGLGFLKTNGPEDLVSKGQVFLNLSTYYLKFFQSYDSFKFIVHSLYQALQERKNDVAPEIWQALFSNFFQGTAPPECAKFCIPYIEKMIRAFPIGATLNPGESKALQAMLYFVIDKSSPSLEREVADTFASLLLLRYRVDEEKLNVLDPLIRVYLERLKKNRWNEERHLDHILFLSFLVPEELPLENDVSRFFQALQRGIHAVLEERAFSASRGAAKAPHRLYQQACRMLCHFLKQLQARKIPLYQRALLHLIGQVASSLAEDLLEAEKHPEEEPLVLSFFKDLYLLFDKEEERLFLKPALSRLAKEIAVLAAKHPEKNLYFIEITKKLFDEASSSQLFSYLTELHFQRIAPLLAEIIKEKDRLGLFWSVFFPFLIEAFFDNEGNHILKPAAAFITLLNKLAQWNALESQIAIPFICHDLGETLKAALDQGICIIDCQMRLKALSDTVINQAETPIEKEKLKAAFRRLDIELAAHALPEKRDSRSSN